MAVSLHRVLLVKYPVPFLIAAGCLAAAAACGRAAQPAGPLDTYRGTISSSCAPFDAPSTALELESVGTEVRVSFNLWPASGVEPPATVTFDTSHPVGQGSYCVGLESCDTATWGKVRVERSSEAGRLSGDWTIGLADGRVFSGTYDADWLAIQAFCG
jgi:hypothetical protein